jgi:hypothetical protein
MQQSLQRVSNRYHRPQRGRPGSGGAHGQLYDTSDYEPLLHTLTSLLDFYKLDYLSVPKPRRRVSNASSSSSSVIMSPISPRSQPISPIFKKGKLNLAFVEDPLLATAAANSTIGPQNPLTPPDDNDPLEYPDIKCMRQDSVIGDLEWESDGFDTMSIPEVEPNRSEPQLIAHSKVYCIADK